MTLLVVVVAYKARRGRESNLIPWTEISRFLDGRVPGTRPSPQITGRGECGGGAGETALPQGLFPPPSSLSYFNGNLG